MNLILSLLLGLLTLQAIPAEEEKYTFLYFYTPNCPSCQEIAPFIDYLKEEYNVPIYAYNMRNPVGYRYGVQHDARYVPLLIIQIERGDEKEFKRYQGVDEIKEAESDIAEISKEIKTAIEE
jgi:thiol-disulfide isomerase/thioredoxin